MNFEQILEISRKWVVKQVIINRALVLMNILSKYDYVYNLKLNKDNYIEFNIEYKKKKLKLILLDASWVKYKRDTFLFNRGTFKTILDELETKEDKNA